MAIYYWRGTLIEQSLISRLLIRLAFWVDGIQARTRKALQAEMREERR